MNRFTNSQAPPALFSNPSRLSQIGWCLIILICATGKSTWAGSFIGSDNSQLDPSFVLHSPNYSGTGGTNTVTVCIDPASAFAAEMEISIRNTITVWNALLGTTDNLKFGNDNNVPSNLLDFESSALHELGHCLGLGHTNVGGAGGATNSNATNSLAGVDQTYDFDSGTDGIAGSSDDLRDDDINLVWYDTASNDPCSQAGSVFDSTAYATSSASLPGGSTFAANPDRDVCAALGHTNTEASMNQLTFFDEAQRTLGHDDAATVKYAQSGIDEVQGTSDDYTSELVYGGMTTTGCDVIAKFDATQTGFAVCSVGFNFPNFPDLTHGTITLGEMFFNPAVSWFFNDQLIGDPQNMAPQLDMIAAQLQEENTLLQIFLTATDVDGDNLTLSSNSLPGFCQLNDNSDGTGDITCAPLAGDANIYSITATATDDGTPQLSAEQNFQLTVVVKPVDTDGDGISDNFDNCTLVANSDQRDTNNDGFGNVCDPDLNNDGNVNFGDVSAWVPFFNSANTGDEDFNGDGFANFGDFSLFPVYFLQPPGPSGLAP